MKFNLKHQTHLETTLKFFALLAVLIGYFFYLSYDHDFSQGGMTIGLTWSFFVLCTPVADAGFLLDFPIRLLFGFRMVMVEIFVWILAISITSSTLFFAPHYFETTLLTRVFHQIITHPIPYWIIIFLCCLGTFASIYFADEMVDVMGHHERTKHHKYGFKYRALALVSLTLLVMSIYYHLISEFGLNIK